MSHKRTALAIYGALLAASHLVRLVYPAEAPLRDERVANVGAKLAYYDSDPQSQKPVLLLVHGSPGSNSVMRGLAERMRSEYRVIAPDLPGFGASQHNIPDYSFKAHAGYVLALLDVLGIEHVHAAGFSMGGGVVLTMANLAPKRTYSIAMISAIGVQEHELTGSYGWNRLLHGIQLAALQALHYSVPHFGLLDRCWINPEYARNFFDSDQRPLRQILASYQGPMLIVHGKHDGNVPPEAAIEHHRLVSQSELVMLDADHFMVFQNPEVVAVPLKRFLARLLPAQASRIHLKKPGSALLDESALHGDGFPHIIE
jgi:pimeloyl-ACP methyl ester carboxylesterase